jgi:hypothetical protein
VSLFQPAPSTPCHRLRLLGSFLNAARALLIALVIQFSSQPAEAEDADFWTAVTVARATWGTATERSRSQAIALAIQACRSRLPYASDCGAEIKTIRTGTIIALRCGDYRILVSGETIAEAEDAAAHRMLQWRYISNVVLGRCTRIIQIEAPNPTSIPVTRTDSARAITK